MDHYDAEGLRRAQARNGSGQQPPSIGGSQEGHFAVAAVGGGLLFVAGLIMRALGIDTGDLSQ